MSEIEDGGPAFPRVTTTMSTEDGDQMHTGTFGASMRDYFAAKAMPVIYGRVESGGFDRVATLAYEMADAMLRAREVKP